MSLLGEGDDIDMSEAFPFSTHQSSLTARGLETGQRPLSGVPGSRAGEKRRVHSARLARDRHTASTVTYHSPVASPRASGTGSKAPPRPKSALSSLTRKENDRASRELQLLGHADLGGLDASHAKWKGRGIEARFEDTLGHINRVLNLPRKDESEAEAAAARAAAAAALAATAKAAPAAPDVPGRVGLVAAAGSSEPSVLRKPYHVVRKEVEDRLFHYRLNPDLQEALHERCIENKREQARVNSTRGGVARRNFLWENVEQAVYMAPGVEAMREGARERATLRRGREEAVAEARRQREAEAAARKAMMRDRPKQMRAERLQRARAGEEEEARRERVRKLLMLTCFASRMLKLRGAPVRVSQASSQVTYRDGLLGDRIERPLREQQRWAVMIIYRWWARVKRKRAGTQNVHRMFVARPVGRRWLAKVRPRIYRRHASNVLAFMEDLGKASSVVRMVKAFHANMVYVQTMWRDQVAVRRAKAQTALLQWIRYEDQLRATKKAPGKGKKESLAGSKESAGGGAKSPGARGKGGGGRGKGKAAAGAAAAAEPAPQSNSHRSMQPVPRDVKLRVVDAFMVERRRRMLDDWEDYKFKLQSWEAQKEINEMKAKFFQGTKLEGQLNPARPRAPRMSIVLKSHELEALHQAGIQMNLEEMVKRLGVSMDSLTGAGGRAPFNPLLGGGMSGISESAASAAVEAAGPPSRGSSRSAGGSARASARAPSKLRQAS